MASKEEIIHIMQRVSDDGAEDKLNAENRFVYDRLVADGVVKSQRQPPDFSQAFQEAPEESGTLADAASRAFTGAVVNVGGGFGQMALEAMEKLGVKPEFLPSAEEFSAVMRAMKAESQRTTTDSPKAGMVAEIGSEILAEPRTKFVKAGDSLIKKVAKEGLEQGLVEGAKLTDEGETRLDNASIGAGSAAVTRGVISGVGGAGKKAFGFVDRKFARDASKWSKEHKIPLTVGEMRNAPFLQKIESLLDKVPIFGTATSRQVQIDAFEKRAKELGVKIGGESENVGATIRHSLTRRTEALKKLAGKRYDIVDRKIAAGGGGNVSLARTRTTAAELLKASERNADLIPDQAGRDLLERWSAAKPRDFKTARELRSKILKEKFRAENAAINGMPAADAALWKRLVRSLDDDMGELAETTGAKAEWRDANNFYKANVVPLTTGPLSKTLAEGYNTDNIVSSFIKRDKHLGSVRNNAKLLLSNLDNRGKKAVKFNVLNDALNEATQGNIFDPSKFSNTLKNLSEANEVIFSKVELSELTGYTKLATIANNASFYAQTAQQIGLIDTTAMRGSVLMAAATAGSVMGADSDNPVVAGAAQSGLVILGGIKGASLLLTTDVGRKLLVRSGKEIDNKLLVAINKEIAHITSQIAAISATD